MAAKKNRKICQELMGIYTTLKVQTSYVLYKIYHCPLILSEHTGKDNQLFKIDYIVTLISKRFADFVHWKHFGNNTILEQNIKYRSN